MDGVGLQTKKLAFKYDTLHVTGYFFIQPIFDLTAALPSHKKKQDAVLGADVLHCRRPSSNLSPENVVEDLSNVFLGLDGIEEFFLLVASSPPPPASTISQLAFTPQLLPLSFPTTYFPTSLLLPLTLPLPLSPSLSPSLSLPLSPPPAPFSHSPQSLICVSSEPGAVTCHGCRTPGPAVLLAPFVAPEYPYRREEPSFVPGSLLLHPQPEMSTITRM